MASRPCASAELHGTKYDVGTEPGTRDQGPAETILASLSRGDRRWALYRDVGPARGALAGTR
jgi:hypothetical protein